MFYVIIVYYYRCTGNNFRNNLLLDVFIDSKSLQYLQNMYLVQLAFVHLYIERQQHNTPHPLLKFIYRGVAINDKQSSAQS